MARAKVTTLNLSNWLHFESIVRLKFASNSEEGEEEEEDEDEKRERRRRKLWMVVRVRSCAKFQQVAAALSRRFNIERVTQLRRYLLENGCFVQSLLVHLSICSRPSICIAAQQ